MAADGNGRMSRLIMNMLQTEYGVIPSTVKKESREGYIKSLVASQEKGDPALFLAFMLTHHMENLVNEINKYNNSVEDDTLNLENDTLNDTLNIPSKEMQILNLIRANAAY